MRVHPGQVRHLSGAGVKTTPRSWDYTRNRVDVVILLRLKGNQAVMGRSTGTRPPGGEGIATRRERAYFGHYFTQNAAAVHVTQVPESRSTA